METIPGLRVRVREAIRKDAPLEFAYRQLGISEWDDLPGVDSELAALRAAFPNLTALSGTAATLPALLQPATQETLRHASHFHFAGHGLAVPGIPELSALVLHPAAPRQYLHQQLIEQLPLAGALVNLSACDTALGAINGAGGLVGLVPAFLYAGSSGILSTLWPLYDRAHVQFATHFYRLLATGTPPDTALALTQRASLRGQIGDRLHYPFHWASTIYYG